jgi:putative ABC transport system permease protein
MPTKACPFRAAAERRIEENRRAFSILQVFGLLKDGASERTAAAEVETVAARFAQNHEEVYRAGSGFRARTSGVLEALTTNARPMLLILLGTTALVLLIACANVANLTIARMLRRDRELAMRSALGADRGRLLRQLLTESTLVALAGGAVGLVFAWSTIDMLTTFVGRFTARTHQIGIDPWVLAFTLGVSVLTGVLFGTLPALSSRVDLMGALKHSGKGAGEASGRRRLQGGLIVAQVAVSVVLLVGAGLLLLSLLRLQRVDAGYRGDRVVTAEIFGNFSRYPDGDSLKQMYQRVLDRLDGAPGVVSAAITNGVPLDGLQPGQTPFEIAGRPYDDPSLAPTADVRVASPRYFDTLGIPLLSGRVFSDLDHADSAPVVVVNQSMTRDWDDRNPVGATVRVGNREWATVVGVVGDVRAFGLDRDAEAQVYVPLRQSQGLGGRVLLRMAGDPMAGASLIREAVRDTDPDMPIENLRTLEDVRSSALATPRLTASLLAIFAALALLVTITGITGVVAMSVTERTQEFGLRMALGASRDAVLAMVLRQGLTLVAVGLALGIAASLVIARVLQGYLYDTAPTDPVAFAVVAAAFIAAGTLACLGPAWRATTVDPMTALRAD